MRKSVPGATLSSLGRSGAAERRRRRGRLIRTAVAAALLAGGAAVLAVQSATLSSTALGGGGVVRFPSWEEVVKKTTTGDDAAGDPRGSGNIRESAAASSAAGSSSGVSAPSVDHAAADADLKPDSAPDASASANTDADADADADAVDRAKKSGWNFFDGDLNQYYNKLHHDEKGNRNPKDVQTFAVHRWLGSKHSTVEQYKLVRDTVRKYGRTTEGKGVERKMRVMDAGCGLGAGLVWFEQEEPSWELVGHTVSEAQRDFIRDELPGHRFTVNLRSYDEPEGMFDALYSIEAFVHSLDAWRTLEAWTRALRPGGVAAIVDDYLAEGADGSEEEVRLFAKSWLANSLHTVSELREMGRGLGLMLVQDFDVGEEYEVVKRNYGNRKPNLKIDGKRTHQGWMGAKLRHKLTVEGKLTYRLLTFRKEGGGGDDGDSRGGGDEEKKNDDQRKLSDDGACVSVPAVSDGGRALSSKLIEAQLRTGVGKDGGKAMKCISGWYCCNKGKEWWDDLEKTRTDRTGFLQLERELFGHYLDVMVRHLNEFYAKLPADFAGGRFLDIGGTGSTASGMTQVTSKFEHWAGPLEYWVLDSDPAAKGLPRCVSCDIADCPQADTCGFDVTFSHTVLEHSSRPWLAFDEVARMTKRGGLTMHLVPFSYQYHATPDDHFRFSHKALRSLLEDRGFEVLEVGYDICEQPEGVKRKRKDEHYEVIWLTYVVGRKI